MLSAPCLQHIRSTNPTPGTLTEGRVRTRNTTWRGGTAPGTRGLGVELWYRNSSRGRKQKGGKDKGTQVSVKLEQKWAEQGDEASEGEGCGFCQNSYSWTTAWRASELHGEKPQTNSPCAGTEYHCSRLCLWDNLPRSLKTLPAKRKMVLMKYCVRIWSRRGEAEMRLFESLQ